MFTRRLLVKHRVERSNGHYIGRRIAHQTADVPGDFLRDPSELVLGEGQHRQQRRALLGVMTQDRLITPLSFFTEFDHRSTLCFASWRLLASSRENESGKECCFA